MTNLSAAGVEALSQALARLYEPIELNQFPERFMEVTGRVVPGKLLMVGLTKPRLQTSDGFMNLPAHHLFWRVQAYREEHLEIPCLADGSYQLSRVPVSLHDQLTLEEFKATAIYEVFYQPLGILYDLTVCFHVSPESICCMTSVRGDRRHSAEERELFRLLQPHLEQRYAQLRQLDPAHPIFSQGKLLQDQHWLLCAANGVITSRSAGVGKLLDLLGLDPEISNLPASWNPWFARQIAPLETRYQRSPLLLPLGKGRISIHSIPNGISGEHRLILEHEPEVAAPEPLTRREQEIARWMLEGKTNPEIAKILGISLSTAKKHVETILRKLGVETRTAAAAMLLREQQR